MQLTTNKKCHNKFHRIKINFLHGATFRKLYCISRVCGSYYRRWNSFTKCWVIFNYSMAKLLNLEETVGMNWIAADKINCFDLCWFRNVLGIKKRKYQSLRKEKQVYPKWKCIIHGIESKLSFIFMKIELSFVTQLLKSENSDHFPSFFITFSITKKISWLKKVSLKQTA